jgi:hypothetical protein
MIQENNTVESNVIVETVNIENPKTQPCVLTNREIITDVLFKL